MTYNSYTQKIVIKNPKEPLKSADLQVRNGKILGFSPLNYAYDKSNGSRTKSLEIIAPGFINLHGHLLYSDLKVKSQNLFPWIAALTETIKQKKNSEEEFDNDSTNLKNSNNFNIYQSSLNGAREAISFGTTFFVDNTNDLKASIEAFKTSGLKGLIGLEIFGSDPDKAHDIFTKYCDEITTINKEYNLKNFGRTNKQESLYIKGLCPSPHALYDVSPELWKLIIGWSLEHNLPVLSHIAESIEEENWFKSMNAPEAKKFWESIGTYEAKEKNWQRSESSVRYFIDEILDDGFDQESQTQRNHKKVNKGGDFKRQSNSDLQNKTKILLAHGVYASEEDLKLLKEKNVALVSCPRSNEYLNNGLPKINLWEELQISYGIGTDSKASNYDLDLRKEVNRLGEVFNLSAKRKFELLTSEAAKILGLDSQIGTLNEGMVADYTVFEVSPKKLLEKGLGDINDLGNLTDEKIFELLFDTEITTVKEVYVCGNKVYDKTSISLLKSSTEA